ncbi:hypothetical protein KIN20_025909 [Parelaphostrongylus tenuis]|uniref:Uncharacterized protein n=1 Tax=Parelaphostrongylus tenuis TaxID=148309 RepID=A0AAD5N9A9_PARTN|nr:hypothetical protein KIN20_025909 [Parelaphostrongylus tenuis]
MFGRSGAGVDNLTKLEWNKPIDVLCANCVNPQQSIARVRSGIIASAGGVTAILALIRIVHLQQNRSSPIRLLRFYVLFVHSITGLFLDIRKVSTGRSWISYRHVS